MGLVNRPHTYVADDDILEQEANANENAIFNEFNGNISDPNVSASAAIQQSKILNLVADIAAKLALVGGTLIGALKIKFSTPYLRLTGEEGSAKDWTIAEDAGAVKFRENTGTEAAPTWTTRYTLPAGAAGPAAVTDLATKQYVDDLVGVIAKATKVDSNFDTTSTSYVNVTGASVGLTTGARRVRVTIIGHFTNLGGGALPHIGLAIDGTDVESGAILFGGVTSNEQAFNFSYITEALTAGSHTFQLRLKASAASNVRLLASAAKPVIMWAEELRLQ